MAGWVYALPWSCDAKRWVFTGVMRIVVDLVQLAFVDFFNKARARLDSARGTTPLHTIAAGPAVAEPEANRT